MNPFAAFSFSLACFFGSVMVLSGQSPHYLAVLCYFKPFYYGFFSFIHVLTIYCLETIIVKPLGSRFSSFSVLVGIIEFKFSKNFCIFSLAKFPIALSLPLNDIFIFTLSPS